jgi:chromosome segregation ATPase
LKALADQKATISELRGKLKTAEQECDEANDEIFHLRRNHQDTIEDYEEELTKLKDATSSRELRFKQAYDMQERRRKELYAKCHTQGSETRRIKIELEDSRGTEAKAKAEAKEAKEQVEKIWEMTVRDRERARLVTPLTDTLRRRSEWNRKPNDSCVCDGSERLGQNLL